MDISHGIGLYELKEFVIYLRRIAWFLRKGLLEICFYISWNGLPYGSVSNL
jgi:hypothetical protein